MTKNAEAGESRAPQVYELAYHLVPTLSESAVSAEVAQVKDVLTSNGAVVIAEELPQPLALAYRFDKHIGGKIEKFTTTHFGWVKFEAQSEVLHAVTTVLDERASVLRFLLVRTVRESTLAPRRFSAPVAREGDAPTRVPRRSVRLKKTPAPVSDEELDRTIQALTQ